jgi:hypothetical protein
MHRQAHRAVALFTSAALLAGCVSTQAQRIGVDDGSDVCRQYVVQLDSTGDFFGESIIQGAAIGAVGGALLGAAISGRWQGALIGAAAGAATGAAGGYLSALQQRNQDQAGLNYALAGDLQRENEQLNRTQLAFDQLMDCRFNTARQVREAYRNGRIPRHVAEAEMAALRNRTATDIQLARNIDQRIGTRGAEFDTAAESVVPGVKNSVITARESPATTATPRAPVVLRLRPDPGAPEVTQVAARQPVQLRPARSGYALVETSSGQRGYAEVAAFSGARGAGTPVRLGPAPMDPTMATQPGDVRSLAASNIARRDNFTAAVADAERATGGFELAS